MLPLIVALPLSAFIWLCSVAILSAAIATGACALYRLALSFRLGCGHMLGGIIGAIIWGWFSLIIGVGALDVGAAVIDGMIARLS